MKNEQDKLSAMLVQKHQLNQAENQVGMLGTTLDTIQNRLEQNGSCLDDMLETMQGLLAQQGILADDYDYEVHTEEVEEFLFISEEEIELCTPQLSLIDTIDFDESMSWDEYINSVEAFAQKNNINLVDDPFRRLMTDTQRSQLEKRIKEEFTIKNAQCDKYDYMIAGTCGLIGGLIDIVFVGLPGQGSALTNFADEMVDKTVEKFATLIGWKGAREDSDPTKSAIGYLERNFKVNYDHRHGGDVDGLFKMSTKNHHIKNLAHSPDIVGLFFSVLDQFTSQAHFVNNEGKIIAIDTDTFELKGNNFISKVFSGFVDWLGHLFSDVAGSSGAVGRGSGIPIPFFSLLQFINIGEFGQHRQTFATIAVQVFEQGYDFRHGIAIAIPVMITELLTRIMWTVKQKAYHKKAWGECVPSADNPELRRMLLVAHGSLCLVDGVDAGVRSGGEIIQFLLRSNIIAWVRFSTLALKELNTWYESNNLDSDAVDVYLEAEYKRMLSA